MKLKTTLSILAILVSIKLSFAQTEIWGMTQHGGQNDGGIIFKTDGNGNNFQTVFSFPRIDGRDPYSGVTEYSNGNLYGVTSEGGFYNCGTIYEFDPKTDTYTKKIDLDTMLGIAPNGYIFLAADENFYGTTIGGGVNGFGTIFKYNPATGTITKIFDFDRTFSGEAAIGSFVQASNGKLYCTTFLGGVNSYGVLFSFDPVANIYNKILDFDGTTNGKYPREGMILASDGMLYGTAGYGGSHGFGILYQLNPITETFVKKFEFDTATVGSPEGYLMQASNGLIYGLSEFGNNGGQLFEFNPVTDSLTEKTHSFSAGMRPNGKLTEVNNGVLIGMALSGGINNAGVIFEYNINTNTFSVRYDFDFINGTGPYGSGIYKTNGGRFFGTATTGGLFDGGTFFEYDPATYLFDKKYDFDFSPDGTRPSSSFILSSAGKLFSMTTNGGLNNVGVLFEYDPLTNNYIKRVDFERSTTGAIPEGNLVEASNGKLYGMASQGGVNDDGVLFEYDPVTYTFLKLADFDSISTGLNPLGNLIEAGNGLLYGLTYSGGLNNSGTLFEYNISTNSITKKIDFVGTTNGSFPTGSLFNATDNFLYGMTSTGGLNDYGVIFRFDPLTDMYTKLFDFDRTNTGGRPLGSLIEASNNKLYGITSYGGLNSEGVVFEFDITSTSFLKLQDFDNNLNGYYSVGTLLAASNGKFYGTTVWGGQNDDAILFEYDPSSNFINKKFDFYNANCRMSRSDLIEIDLTLLGILPQNDEGNPFQFYPNPVNESLYITSVNNLNKGVKITINDIIGKIVFEKENVNLPVKINLSELATGIYITKLTANNQSYIHKFIVEQNK